MNEKLHRAGQLVTQAREIADRTPDGRARPKPDAEQIDSLLREAANLRKDAERERQIDELDTWISAPQYKHDMSLPIEQRDGYTRDADGGQSRTIKSFLQFVRSGLDSLAPERKADLVEDATGQNLVPTDFAGTILKELAREAVIRNVAYVRPTSRNKVDVGNIVVGSPTWGVLETGASAADGLGANPAGKDTITVHDLTALVKLGRDELEDADEGLAETIRLALAAEFAKVEDDAFAGGSGSGQPWGITHNVTQSVTAAVASTVVADDLKKLTFAVPARFRRNGVFLGHSGVEQAIALMKDSEGRYLLQPSTKDGEPMTLFGYRWHTVDGLPSMGTTGTATDPSVVFGDVRSGYMVADRRRLTVQRLDELYAAQGKVGFLFTHRVGGDVIRPTALATYLL